MVSFSFPSVILSQAHDPNSKDLKHILKSILNTQYFNKHLLREMKAITYEFALFHSTAAQANNAAITLNRKLVIFGVSLYSLDKLLS